MSVEGFLVVESIKYGKHEVVFDMEDWDIVSARNWGLTTSPTAKGLYVKESGGDDYLARVILGAGKDTIVDHKNGNTLDNRRQNLRICTRAENTRNMRRKKTNTSGYKGVSWNKACKKWQAHIMVDYKSKYLGLFEHKNDAAHAYDAAARKYFGEFACVNFPRQGEQQA